MKAPMLRLWAVTFGFAVGCGRGGPPEVATVPAELNDSIVVQVVNNHFYDANIYAEYDGAGRRWMGTVRGNNSEEEFTLPWSPRQLAFRIDLVVGPGIYRSYPISVDPGDRVELTLPRNFAVSAFFRRVGR